MEKGQKVKIKNIKQIGTIIKIVQDMVLISIYKRGSFFYLKSNLELLDRFPVSDCIENSQ